MGSTVKSSVNGESAGAAAEIQNISTAAVRLESAAVFLLIQEVAGFLSSELRSAAGRIITVRTSLPDVLYRMDTMGTQNYWMRNYYPDFVN